MLQLFYFGFYAMFHFAVDIWHAKLRCFSHGKTVVNASLSLDVVFEENDSLHSLCVSTAAKHLSFKKV